MEVCAYKMEGTPVTGMFKEADGMYMMRMKHGDHLLRDSVYELTRMSAQEYKDLMRSQFGGKIILGYMFFPEDRVEEVLEWHQNAILMSKMVKGKGLFD